MSSTRLSAVTSITAVLSLTACGASTATPTGTSPNPVSAQVVSVSPAGGATAVSTSASVVVTFSRPMHAAAASYLTLHSGSLTGPMVAGRGAWSGDSTQFTFSPDSMMAAHATYVLHMGGAMLDAAGDTVSLSRCAQFGGQAATAGMMGGGMMGGSEMGPGWQTPGTNTYGMTFTFTTQ